jgi:hypothetical protein
MLLANACGRRRRNDHSAASDASSAKETQAGYLDLQV